jgi:hypothetical protein
VIGQSTASAVGGVSQDSGDAPSGSAAGVSPASNGAGREVATDTKEADMKEVGRQWAS